MSTPTHAGSDNTDSEPTRHITTTQADDGWSDSDHAVVSDLPPENTGSDSTVGRDVDTETLISEPRRVGPDRDTVVNRQKESFGGMKAGSAFFGWLTATGMAVLLIALLAAVGVGFGLATDANVDQAVSEASNASDTAKTVGLVGGIVLLVILFLSYFCGGYVAGRMARFNGAKQGLAVWLLGIVMVLVIAAITAIAGAKFNIFAQLNLPRLPVSEGDVTTTAIIAIAAAIIAALLGALLGGQVGMRYHRKVDAAGFRDEDDAISR